MYRIDGLTNDAKQEFIYYDDNSNKYTIGLEYRDNQVGWYLSLKYGDTVNYSNIRVTTHYNLLRSYRNYLTIGIRIDTEDDLEPMSISDWVNGYATFNILTAEECAISEEKYFGKV